jgi:septum formation protein
MKVLLASASPRRRDLLRQIGWEAVIRPVDFAERQAGDPDAVCLGNARGKAADAAARYGDALPVVAADTIVTLDGAVLGKPADAAGARAMLRTLSGRTHAVKTAVAVRWRGQERVAVATTVVTFRLLTDEEIEAYVATGEPMDKAGAYGIQGKGALLVSRIDGAYDNVVGLPRTLVYTILQGLGAL